MPTFQPTKKKFPNKEIGSLSIPVKGYVTQYEEESFQEIYGEYTKNSTALKVLTDALELLSQEIAQASTSPSELAESGETESGESIEAIYKDLSKSSDASNADPKSTKIAELQSQIQELLPKVNSNRLVLKLVAAFLRSRVDPEWTEDIVYELIPPFFTNQIYDLLTSERNSSFLQEPTLENQESQNTSPTETVEQTGQESS